MSNAVPASTPFYRVRFVIEATRDIRIPARQGAMIYALLAAANKTDESPAAFPRDLLLDVPEENRMTIQSGETYAFGGTLLANTPAEALGVIQQLRVGLTRLSTEGKPRRDGLGGNFRLESIQDLVDPRDVQDQPPSPMPVEFVSREIHALLGRGEITLSFLSPLRLERPGHGKQEHESFFNRRYFDAAYFVRRLLRRMATVGLQPRSEDDQRGVTPEAVQVVDNRLIWLDLAYGGPQGKSLGGAVGRVRLRFAPDNYLMLAALAWGQWTRVGKNTHFGFGRYRIEELGDEPLPCARAVSLLSLAWNHPLADRLSSKAGLEAGVLSQTVRDIDEGTYQPHPPVLLEIGEEPKRRQLQIPSRRDRVLQRLVLEVLGPALDSLFESSSFAWRRGLSRHHSARAISTAFRQGYRYAVNADFDRFFETIDHAALEDRLLAYVGDRGAVSLILQWVRSAPTSRTRGIPTGATLSPLLGNLFLDGFDEQIAEQGGRLIRYGDDLLILCRTEDQARQLLNSALIEAQSLKLRLNELPQPIIPLDEPFTFLGFHFEHHDQWQIAAGDRVRSVEELGWKEASSPQGHKPVTLKLPGETGIHSGMGLSAIVGPGATHFEWRPGVLRCHYTQGREPTEIPLPGLETLIVLGRLGVSAEILQRICDQSVTVVMADDRGLPFGTVSADESIPSSVLIAQVEASQSPQICLNLARSLIVAKLHNYRRLAEAVPRRDEACVQTLMRCATQADTASSLAELRGIEGYGAATWYGSFSKHLGRGFVFERRVAPNAEDPVNVLLNIAQTLAYRLSVLAIRAAGLVPSLGLMHDSNSRFAPLAADLQEPFRFLMDRVVIEATHVLRPGDFRRSETGPYRLLMAPDASRQFQLLLWKGLSLSATASVPVPDLAAGGSVTAITGNADEAAIESGQPTCYRIWIERQARQLRRLLVAAHASSFFPFRLP